jgi:hypothetical protein
MPQIFSQIHPNPSPGHFLMSYWNGLAGLSPKFASTNISSLNVTVGKRRSTVGTIGNGRSEK